MRPFKFLADARDPMPGRDLAALARRAEAMGYHALVVPDHLIPQLSPVPALATIAAATERLRIGAFVLNNDLRHPAVLAQDLASLDVLSGGRLDIAHRRRLEQARVRRDRPAVRPGRRSAQARLAEAITVLKGCFGGRPFSFAGEHYTITDYDGRPEAGPAAASAVPHRRRRPADARRWPAARRTSSASRRGSGRDAAVGPASLTLAGDARRRSTGSREAAGDRFAELEFNIYPSTWPVVVTDDLPRRGALGHRPTCGREPASS